MTEKERDPLDAILEAARLDDEPSTPHEEVGVAESRRDFESGVIFDAAQLKRELG